jgi:hypothetical protein
MIMGKLIDITGKRFGRWKVLGVFPGHYRPGKARWVCRCNCGTLRIVIGTDLRRGKSKSCGCLQREKLSRRRTTHGHTCNGKRSHIYQRWQAMLQRCFNPNNAAYSNYGGRGISVCDEWLSFESFFADMGEPPAPDLTIDRIDSDGNYEPGNCQWATRAEQTFNRRPRKQKRRRGKLEDLQAYAAALARAASADKIPNAETLL